MKEKFSDFEGMGFLSQTGTFLFEIMDAELMDSKKGEPMWKFTAKCDVGQTTLYHSLNPRARWSFNGLIKACLNIKTKEQIEAFECDYSKIGQELIGKKFSAAVVCEPYKKEIKVPNDDGTFTTSYEEKDGYKVETSTYTFAPIEGK